MNYGMDTDASGNAVCAVRRWPERNLVAGYLLFVYGTKPSPQSVCPDCHEKSLIQAENIIQEHLESVAANEGSSDPRFVAACISDILQKINRRTYELAAFIGQGIALGGTVMFQSGDALIATAFGGGRMHFWDGNTLYPQGEIPAADGLVHDALGTRQSLKFKYWHGRLMPNQRFICTSDILPDLAKAAHAVTEGSRPGSHNNTVAMLLRKELEMRNIHPTAVLEFSHQEGGVSRGPDTA